MGRRCAFALVLVVVLDLARVPGGGPRRCGRLVGQAGRRSGRARRSIRPGRDSAPAISASIWRARRGTRCARPVPASSRSPVGSPARCTSWSRTRATCARRTRISRRSRSDAATRVARVRHWAPPGGRGERHDGSVVHFALRAGDTYIDPMALLRPVDLATIVHLAPTSVPPYPRDASSERRGLLAGLAHDVAVAGHAVVVALEAGRSRRRSERVGVGTSRSRRRRCGPVPNTSRNRAIAIPHAPPADGEGGSGHRVMIVGGIDSHLTGTNSSRRRCPRRRSATSPTRSLTSRTRRDGGDYVPADTEGPIMTAARRLAAQLRALQRREPGREVDLLAHSQGGVVVETFLTHDLQAAATARTRRSALSSRCRRRCAATPLGDRGRRHRTLDAREAGARRGRGRRRRRRHAGAGRITRPPRPRGRLRPDAQARAPRRGPTRCEVTTIGAATDIFVPGNAATLPGARATDRHSPRAERAHRDPRRTRRRCATCEPRSRTSRCRASHS